jgi:RHS repeat-associated protein
VDRRDKSWLFQYDAAGNRTKVRHPESGRTWRTGYNGHHEVVFERVEDGVDVVSTEFLRGSDGRLVGVREDGRGTRWVTFDNSGDPVWMRDGEGNETLLTREPVDDGASAENERRSTEANIRLGAAEVLTTTTVTEYDERFLPVARTDYGHGASLARDHFWDRDAAGFVDRYVNPEQVETVYEARNLRGWPLTTAQERDGGWDRSHHTYDARGELVRVADPTGQATTYEFTPFGELASVTKPHYSQPVETYQYDHLGRRTLMSRANNDERGVELIAYEYDSDTGDPVREVWLNAPKSIEFSAGNLLIERTFDSLGRLTQATNYNPGLALFGPNVVPSEFIVHREFDYDVLDRVHRESTSVGSSGSYDTESSYWLGGGAAPNAWNRVVAYPDPPGSSGQQTVLAEYYDRNGRLDRVWGSVDQHTTDVSNEWLGELYAGREQFWAANASPIAEQAEYDDLGRRLAWEYTAVDLDDANHPVDGLWGQEYCGGSWDPECSRPLLRMDAVRDVMGRIGSLHWSFGHPRFEQQGSRIPASTHLEHWRGYTYDKRGALIGKWKHQAQVHEGIDDTPLWSQNNSLVASTIDSFGMQQGAEAWDYLREAKVGGLIAIENRVTSDSTWSASLQGSTGSAGPVRADGHQLDEVRVDQTSYRLEHDYAGGVVSALGFDFEYDPYGRLMAVLDASGDLVEAFAHDHEGRMAAKYDDGGVTEVYAYDGEQIIAAIDAFGDTLWQAVWGAGLDQLLNWYDGKDGDLYVPVTDHRNSVVASWSVAERGVDQIARYNPHGRLRLFDADEDEQCAEEGDPGRVCNNPSGIPFGFASALRSEATGLVYMRNRWYSPRLAQFITHDPKGYVDSYNPYAYVGMDPINFWDPWGLVSKGFGTPEDVDDKHGWNPLYMGLTRLWLTFGADDDVRDRKHRRHMKKKFGGGIDVSEITCGVSCELTNMAEAANSAVESVELAVGAVGIKRLGQYGIERLGKRGTRETVEDVGEQASRNADAAGDVAKSGRQPSRVCSFVAGTQVHLCDGTTISIEEVEEGDFVLTKDADTGAIECRMVANPYANPDRSIIELELEAEDGTLETIDTTDNHPFYVEGRGWTRVDELDIGDRIPSAYGGLLRVTSATWTQRVETVYNFGVEEFRSYFVGESAAWVHNCFDSTRKYLRTTPREKVDEATVAESLLGDGLKHRWGDGQRVHFEDAAGKIRARIDPPDGTTNYRHLHLYNKKGEALDVTGTVVSPKSPDAHIPLEGVSP